MSEDYLDTLTRLLQEAGVNNARHEAEVFMAENPDLEKELTAEEAAKEWMAGADDAASFRDPAAGYGPP